MSYQGRQFLFPMIGGVQQSYLDKVVALGPLAYWPLNEAAGGVATDYSGNGYDGAYTGVTLGQDGIGDGNTCPLFDGANDRCNIYSVGFAAAFTGALCTVAAWLKVSGAGVWTDGSQRHALTLYWGAAHRIYLYKQGGASDDKIQWYRKGNNVVDSVTKLGMSTTGWFHMAMTVSETADQVIAYYDGLQEGVIQTGLGAWGGAAGANNQNIGSFDNVPLFPWDGYLAHVAIWNRVLSPAEALSLATV